MNKTYNAIELAACIKQHRLELFARIEKNLKQDKQLLVFFRKKQLKTSLDHFLNDIIRLLKEGANLEPPSYARTIAPFDYPREKIYFHFLAEKFFVQALKELMQITDEEWLGIRYRLVKIFHNVLRPTVSSSCANCQSAIEEDLAKATRLEVGLKSLFAKK